MSKTKARAKIRRFYGIPEEPEGRAILHVADCDTRAACRLRFRPILMTTLAALFGALPLAFGTGLGSEPRRPLGMTIVGGLLASQLLTLYTTPVVYLALERLRLLVCAGRSRDSQLAPAE